MGSVLVGCPSSGHIREGKVDDIEVTDVVVLVFGINYDKIVGSRSQS